MHEQSGKDLAHQVGAQFGGLFGLGAGLAKDMAKDVGVVSKGDDKAAQAAKEAAVANRVERVWLFHGTDEDTVPKITSMGFNRSFCGKNATAYGKGVYFATNSSCACRPLSVSKHRPPDATSSDTSGRHCDPFSAKP